MSPVASGSFESICANGFLTFTQTEAIDTWWISLLIQPPLENVEFSSTEIELGNYIMKSGYGQVGNFHGIWVSGGINRGRYSRFQSCRKLNWYLSCKITWWGGSPSPSHLLRSASAKSLSWPGMCDTSTSMLELEIRRLSFSKRSAIGMVVENSLLDAASAVVLPDNVGMRMGILEPGKNWMAIYTKAICARVSRLEMSFWRLSLELEFAGIGNHYVSWGG